MRISTSVFLFVQEIVIICTVFALTSLALYHHRSTCFSLSLVATSTAQTVLFYDWNHSFSQFLSSPSVKITILLCFSCTLYNLCQFYSANVYTVHLWHLCHCHIFSLSLCLCIHLSVSVSLYSCLSVSISV